MKVKPRFCALPLLVGLLCGCGSGDKLTPTPPHPSQTQLSISPPAANVAAGGSRSFSASMEGNANPSVTWAVNGVAGGNSSVGTISAAGTYVAPLSASRVVISAALQTDANTVGKANVSVLAPHRFGVRPTATLAEFFDRSSGNPFTPRSNNYIRLATLIDPNGIAVFGHSTFSVDLYDSARAESALAQMQASGYNVVTVTLQGCCQNTLGDPAGGLSPAYLANVVDFLSRAKADGIAVVIASSWLPAFGGYNEMLGACYPQFDDINLTNLSACGVSTVAKFYQDFVQGLINAGAAIDAIFAYEIWDEYYYNATAAPLTSTSGTVTAANGLTYDMGSTASHQQMMDDGLMYFGNQVRAAILALDPTALVTMSFFQPEGPNPTRLGDPRIISVYPAVANSTLDYIDLHAYPVIANLTLHQYVQNFGFIGYQQQKPIVMGEMGAFTFAYASLSDAAAGLRDWQIQSCNYNFKGWALWTWDTDEQAELWNAMSQSGVIDQALAPAVRPDPCSP